MEKEFTPWAMFAVDQKPEFQSLNLAREEALSQLNSGAETPASGLESVDRETVKNHLRTLILGHRCHESSSQIHSP
jgi:hypothetical protein